MLDEHRGRPRDGSRLRCRDGAEGKCQNNVRSTVFRWRSRFAMGLIGSVVGMVLMGADENVEVRETEFGVSVPVPLISEAKAHADEREGHQR